ncbi:MAG: hypothetical protein HGA96_15735 [Desulfobulbaceae bacterium]|nr:hypothetical protein [Desulfobulbaceae bacterium]
MTYPVAVTAALRLTMEHEVPALLARELRRADDFIRLAVVGGYKALAMAPVRELIPEARGVFIGTAFGPLETNFQSLGSLINDGEGQISPTLFSHSVYNAAAGYAARLLDFRGPALTVTDYGWPFLVALEEARWAVASGRVERALVLGVEVYSELLADAYRRSFAGREVPWRKGAVAWVLDRAEAVEENLVRLEAVTVTGLPCATGDYLTRAAELCRVAGREVRPEGHALAAVSGLTDLVKGLAPGGEGEVSWQCSATFGNAVVRMMG